MVYLNRLVYLKKRGIKVTTSNEQLGWKRLDNTAKLFPVIANENLSNVFRVSVTLKEKVLPEILRQALEEVLPWFEGFRVRLRRGVFWYYFEMNTRQPMIEEESTYPCQYIDPRSHQMFLFRVSYYEKRINLEVFHAITDGMGAMNFLKELTYHYLKLKKAQQDEGVKSEKINFKKPSRACYLDTEDSYIKNYKSLEVKGYSKQKAYQLQGELLEFERISVIHGYINIEDLKKLCKAQGVSVTKYLTALIIWGIYKEYLNGQASQNPIAINIPINLRKFFESTTTRNFFAVSMIEFLPVKASYTFEEVLQIVSSQMDEKITKEKLEKTISYNVSNEKKFYLRFAPLPFKYLALKYVFSQSNKATTTTLSNLGAIDVLPEFKEEIERFHFIIGVSKKQKMKCSVCSYGSELVLSFATVLKEPYLQRSVFRQLTQEGVRVKIESNGVLNEKMS